MSNDELLDSLTAQIMALPGRPRENAMLFTALLSMAVGDRRAQQEEEGREPPDEV